MKGNIIKAKIFEKDLSVKEIADILNINKQTLTNWINGRNTKQIDKFLELIILLDLDIKELKGD